MSGNELAVATAAKEREAQAVRARLEALDARLAIAASRRKELGDLLGEGEDGEPLAMPPLHAALVGAVAANGALFFSFVVYLTRFQETIWSSLLVLMIVLGGASLPLSSRPGAGGRARVGLRRFAIAGLALALAGGLLTAMTR